MRRENIKASEIWAYTRNNNKTMLKFYKTVAKVNRGS